MKTVYLPIEIKHRELVPRIMTAAHLVKSGHRVFIGQQWGVFSNFKNLSPGVILFKTVNAIQGGIMERFKSQGYAVAALDEEVLCCANDFCFTHAISEKALQNCDLFFAQSKAHKNAVKFPAVEVTGNPRTGIPKRVVESYREKSLSLLESFGPFVLFNTNFGIINSHWGDVDVMRGIFKQAGIYDESRFEQEMAWEKSNITAMAHVIEWCIENLDHNLIIRPHPGESVDFWKKYYADKVTIIERSDPNIWLCAADLMVHTRCTTGLEAAVLGCTAVNIEPEPHPFLVDNLAEINPTFRDWKEATKAMLEYFQTDTGNIHEFKPKLEPQGETAAQTIAEGLSRLAFDGTEGRYARQPRTDVQRDKCTISMDEMTEALGFCSDILESVNLSQLDDSLFVMT